jgi:hypothetical protein
MGGTVKLRRVRFIGARKDRPELESPGFLSTHRVFVEACGADHFAIRGRRFVDGGGVSAGGVSRRGGPRGVSAAVCGVLMNEMAAQWRSTVFECFAPSSFAVGRDGPTNNNADEDNGVVFEDARERRIDLLLVRGDQHHDAGFTR